MTFINKALLEKQRLFEATLEKDIESEQTAQQFISKMYSLVDKFPNKFIAYNKTVGFVTVKIGGLIFQIFDKNSQPSKDAGNYNAAFVPRNNTIDVFHANINYDEQNKKLTVDISDNQENEIKHEIIHFLDLKRSGEKGTNEKMKKELQSQFDPVYYKWATKNNFEPNNPLVISLYQSKTNKGVLANRTADSKYINDPYEMNAHFIEYVMPKINKYISNKGEIPKKFDEFKKEILDNNSLFTSYYNKLEDKNKKRFLKRLAVYYQSLRDFTLKDTKVDFSKAATTLDINKDVLDKTIEKVISLFKRKAT